MPEIDLPTPPPVGAVTYGAFKGVDFSKDALLVDKSRAAYAQNMISDKSGLPEKRLGYRIIQRLDGRINGILSGRVGNSRHMLVHAGDKLYSVQEDSPNVVPKLLISGIFDGRSTGFSYRVKDKNRIYIFTGAEYLEYDGDSVTPVSEGASIPVILIARHPSGGGTPLDPINLLCKKRTEKFYGDGIEKEYQLAATDIDSDVLKILVTDVAGEKEVSVADYTVNKATGRVLFKTAPKAPPVSGEDNVTITYEKTTTGYRERVEQCTHYAFYGQGGENRVFITGNPKYPAGDWHSQMADPSYFPDLSYAIFGTENGRVMGYSKIGTSMLIIKQDMGQETTVYMRSIRDVTDDKDTQFPIMPGITGIGAVSPYSFASLVDEPLFLSMSGVFAITTNTATTERTLQNRSFFIDNRLLKEKNLHEAVAVVWNGYYLLCAGGNIYLMDSRQKSFERYQNTNFVYECYYWTNIPARCFFSQHGQLYFGTEDGALAKLNTDIDEMKKYLDDGKAIHAIWDTKEDDDGNGAVLKTMQKRGGTLTLKPFSRTSAKISVSVDGTGFRELAEAFLPLFNFEDLDFDRFSFFTGDNPQKIYFNQKVKKYTTLQFRVENKEPEESLGVYELTKYYTSNNYGKE